jgi:hypothetical protein
MQSLLRKEKDDGGRLFAGLGWLGATIAAAGAVWATAKLVGHRGDVVSRAITINLPVEQVERAWLDMGLFPEATVELRTAPGDRGTELEVTQRAGAAATLVAELARFKQLIETGEVLES